MENLNPSILHPDKENSLPLIIENPTGSVSEFGDWYLENKKQLTEQLLGAGAIYFKGVGVETMSDYTELMNKIEGQANAYLDGNSPRKKHNDDVYNASEYDQNAKINLHTEYSYSYAWPGKLFFCCTHPAAEGGETTLADCRKVLNRMNPEVVKEFETKQIRYIRNLHNGEGFGPSWQDAFETEDKQFLEKHCLENDLILEWKEGDSAKISQTRPAIRNHPITGERLWFNQVDQFFPKLYGEEMYEALLMIAGNDVEGMPMYSTFGDGSEISLEAIEHVMEVLEAEEIRPKWEKGDLMMVENMLSLHGRMPFKGDRQVYVFMK